MGAVRTPAFRRRTLVLLAALGALALVLALTWAIPGFAQNLETEVSKGLNRIGGMILIARRVVLVAALAVLMVLVFNIFFSGRFNTRLLVLIFGGLALMSLGGVGIEYLIDTDIAAKVQSDTGGVLTEEGFR